MKTILYMILGFILLSGALWIDRVAQNNVDIKYDSCAWQFGIDYQALGLSTETFPDYQKNCMKMLGKDIPEPTVETQ